MNKFFLIKLKKALTLAFKIIVGFGLILYLILSGHLNFGKITSAISHHPWWFLGSVSLSIIPLILTTLRWQMLLSAQSINITFWRTLSLNFIGLFFNIFIPGGTGGDLVKCYYLISMYPEKKTATITTVLIDRFLGLSGLVLVGSISVLLNLSFSLGGKGMIKIFSSSILGASVIIIVGLILFLNFPVSFFETYTEKLSHFPGGKIFLKFYEAVKIYRNHQALFYLLLLLSLSVHITIIIMSLMFGKIFGSSLNWRFYGIITPLGLIANALPIAPAGLGVGEAAFVYLYQMVGSPFGGEIMALFHIISIITGLLGLPFYLLMKKEPEYAKETNPSDDLSVKLVDLSDPKEGIL